MGKLKILEMNKTLNTYANDVLDQVIQTQSESQTQMQNAKKLESELLTRIRERDERREQARAEQEAQANAAVEAPEAKAAETVSESKAPEAAPQAEAEVQPKPQAESETAAPVTEQPEKPAEERKPAAEAPRPAQARPREEQRPQTQNPAGRTAQPRQNNNGQNRQGSYSQRPQGERPYNNQNNRNGFNAGGRPPFNRDKDNEGNDVRHRSKTDAKPRAAFAPPAGGQKPNTHDARKKKAEDDLAARKRRSMIKEKGVFAEDEFPRGSKKVRKKDRPKQAAPIEPIRIDKAVITGDTVSVKLFAEKTGKPVAEILKKLLLLGMMCTINSEIDYDTASLVADDFGITLEQRFEQTAEDVLIAEDKEDAEEDLQPRPPVVTIMGHVDHGKTSLLDAIRKTKVTAGEAGGITQHIGAYTIKIKGQSITFLDTPGHEAFTAMRARGAQATDIAVLVVAADDGVMPQTIEAINHAKSAKVPIIVAINKIDKEGANVERIKQNLTEYELVAEEWGGDTIMVPVSALTGEGISSLLEMILLVADVQELKANPNRLAKGTIIEARLDKGRGPVATVLVQNGTLRVQDTIVAGTAYGRVRAMLNDEGKAVKAAGPSQPVEVIGFSEVPEAGDIIYAVEQDKLSRQVAEERRDKIKAAKLKSMSKVSLDDLFSQIAEGQIKDLNLVVKADVQGSVEAVRQSLEKLSNDEVRVRVIHGAVGAISESDILLASASNAIIIGFNVRPDAAVSAAAERENVDIRLYRVIYNAIEDITKAMQGMLAPEYEEKVIGHVEVRQTFKVSSVGTVAGCYVQDGKVVRNASVRLLRDSIVIHEGKLSSLKRFKDDAKEVAAGYECGITLDNFNDIKEGDILEVFEVVEVER